MDSDDDRCDDDASNDSDWDPYYYFNNEQTPSQKESKSNCVAEESQLTVYKFNGVNTVFNSALSATTELEFFQCIFTPELFLLVIDETNRLAQQSSNTETPENGEPPLKRKKTCRWFDVDVAELSRFFALSILMGHLRKDNIKDYWTTDPLLQTPFFAKCMSRDRYNNLLRNLNFENNDKEPDEKKPFYDRLWKIRRFFDTLNQNFKDVYYPTEEMAVDKVIVSSNGLRFYTPKDRECLNIKIYKLTDRNGYIYNMSVHGGRELKFVDESLKSNAHRSVIDLIQCISGNGHKLFVRDILVSPNLFSDLLKDHKINSYGTMNTDQKTHSRQKLKLSEIARKRGGKFSTLCIKDKQEIFVIDGPKQEDLGSSEMKTVSAKEIVGFSDHNPETEYSYLFGHRSTEWAKRLFFLLLDLSVMNSYILFKISKKSNIPFKDYRLKLITQLIESSMVGQGIDSMTPITIKYTPRKAADMFKSEVLGNHWPVRLAKTRRRCVVCKSKGLQKRSTITCKRCDVGLCINCFEVYHVEDFPRKKALEKKAAKTNKGNMPATYIRKSSSTRGQWTEANLKNAVKAVEEKNVGVNEAAKTFSVPKTTLKRRIKTRNFTKGALGPSSVLGSDNENKIVLHIQKLQNLGFSPSRDSVCYMAFELAEKLKIHNTFNKETKKAGYDWLQLFLARNQKLSIRKTEGVSVVETKGMNKKTVDNYFKLLEGVLKENDLNEKPLCIFNMDETSLQLNNKPGKEVASTISAEKGETISLLACCNGEGIFLPPYCIFKGENIKHEFLDGMPPGAQIKMSPKSAYVNSDIFLDWLKNHFTPRKPIGKVLLILDSHSSHTSSLEMLEYAEENDIILLSLPPHTTHWLQPLAHSFFKSLKANYYAACNNFLKNNPSGKINQLQFGNLLNTAWLKSANAENGISGFRACGIIPFNPDVTPHYAYLLENGVKTVTNTVPEVDPAVVPSTSKQNTYWMQCVSCLRWLHEGFSRFEVTCNSCGKKLNSKV